METEEPEENSRDHPRIIAPPPLIFGGALLLTLLVDWGLGDPSIGLGRDGRFITGLLFIIVGFPLIAIAVISFRNARTNIEPWKPTTALVTSGLFAYSRNPVYVGMALGYIGLSFIADSVVSLLALPLVIAVIHC
ncbi:MAG: hypothetical protein KTR19_12380, partial [Hyphomicrobiales bacterium]|nr:hypothetical protein [Hyphomicrobiales bacterium]